MWTCGLGKSSTCVHEWGKFLGVLRRVESYDESGGMLVRKIGHLRSCMGDALWRSEESGKLKQAILGGNVRSCR